MGVFGSYRNGNYTVLLNLKNGDKIRYNDNDELLPDTYENIDLCISKKCTNGCEFCYEGCTPTGVHADIMNLKFIETLHPWTEVAINGNEPLHPDLVPFLEKCKKLKLVPSITVNQKTFMKNYEFLLSLKEKKLIYGLGVSLSSEHVDAEAIEFVKLVEEFPNAIIHVINGIVKPDMMRFLAGRNLKILILGYKEIRRGEEYYEKHEDAILLDKWWLSHNLKNIIDDGWFDVVSFDNLALKQIDVKGLMSEEEWQKRYMGDDGKVSFYIDAVDGGFSESSLCMDRFDMRDNAQEMLDMIKLDKAVKENIENTKYVNYMKSDE